MIFFLSDKLMDTILTFEEALNCAKNFENFDDIYVAVSLHPDWLTAIPEKRAWAIIHHVTLSGNISHLDQLLALQTPKKDFRLLTESRHQKTILDIARAVKDGGQILKHIERIVKLDEMLNYARTCDWDKCYDIVSANTEYGNQKPSYRRFFLIHHMACANAIKEFERFSSIPGFRFILNLRADRKKINQIARENNGIEFAKYIERKYPTIFENDTQDDRLYEPNDQAKEHTKNVNIVMAQRNLGHAPETSSSLLPSPNAKTRGEVDRETKEALSRQKRTANVSKIMSNNSIDAIRSLLTCSLTQAIMTDPGRQLNILRNLIFFL